MVYLDYENAKLRYKQSQKRLDDLLTEKERLFIITQPNAIRYDNDKIQVTPKNKLDEYVIALEKVEAEIKSLEMIIATRKRMVEEAEDNLRQSQDQMDAIYLMKYVNGYNVPTISLTMNYSKSQIYRILQVIRKNIINMRQNATTCDQMRKTM